MDKGRGLRRKDTESGKSDKASCQILIKKKDRGRKVTGLESLMRKRHRDR